jgi:hypothetical protein
MFLHNFLCLPPSMSSPLPQSKGFILQDPLPIEPTSLREPSPLSKNPTAAATPAGEGEALYYENTMMVISSTILTPSLMEGQGDGGDGSWVRQ